jgi:hypothetical protein
MQRQCHVDLIRSRAQDLGHEAEQESRSDQAQDQSYASTPQASNSAPLQWPARVAVRQLRTAKGPAQPLVGLLRMGLASNASSPLLLNQPALLGCQDCENAVWAESVPTQLNLGIHLAYEVDGDTIRSATSDHDEALLLEPALDLECHVEGIDHALHPAR